MKGTGADVMVRYLEVEGVTHVFGLPGGHLLGLYDSLRSSSIEPILNKHEGGAAYMAAGYAAAGGRLGVCCGTVGPGATNLVSGVAAAHMASVPLLAITAQVGTSAFGRGALQEAAGEGRTFSQVELFRSVTKHSELVFRPDGLPDAIRRALRIAHAGRPGAVHLDLPADVLKATVQDEVPSPSSYRPVTVSLPDPDAVEHAAKLLSAADRPAMLVGAGGRRGGAPDAVLALAEILACPVATTLLGKGAIAEDHPLSLGTMGLYGTRAANSYMRSGLDVLMVVGASMHEFSTHVWDPALEPKTALIQLDIDPLELGKNYPVDVALLGSAEFVLPAVVSTVATLGASPARTIDFLKGLKESSEYFAEPSMSSDAVPTKPQRVMAEVAKVLPDDAVVVTDIGNNLTWVERNLMVRRPDTLVSFTGLAGMGSGVAAAVGAKSAAPERPVVAICGDGDFQMHGMEVMTAVNHDIPLVWLILENGRLAMIHDVQTMSYQGRHVASSFRNPDFVALANAFGAFGLRADTPDQIGPALERALEANGPAVLTVPVDPDEMPPAKPRMLAMERSMGLPSVKQSMSKGAAKALLDMFKER